MKRTRWVGWSCTFSCLLAVVSLFGCAPNAQVEITGAVWFEGKKVPSGTVTFLGADGNPVSGVIRNGEYKVSKVAVGEARITVVTQSSAPKGLLRSAGPEAKIAPAEKPMDIPAHYRNPASSELTYDVKPGTQSHEIKLYRKEGK